MKLKGLIWFFVVILILFSTYLLSHTWFIKNFENKIKSKATKIVKSQYPDTKGSDLEELIEKKTDEILLGDSAKAIKIFPVTGKTYGECKEDELRLGLDLQGGMNVTMDVSLEDLLRSLSNDPSNENLNKAIKLASAEKKISDKDYISLFQKSFEGINAGKLSDYFTGKKRDDFTVNATDDNKTVISKIRNISEGAIKQTYKILTKRIDNLGVVSPNISLDESKGIINVELAGVKDKERAKKILQSSANLQFWEVYDGSIPEFVTGLQNADKAMATLLNDTSNPNPMFSLMQVTQPYQEENKTKYPGNFAFMRKQDIPKLDTMLANPVVRAALPSDLRILYGQEDDDPSIDPKNKGIIGVYAIRTYGKLKADLEGDRITGSRADMEGKRAIVRMEMDAVGARVWGNLTTKNEGRAIAIVMDNIVYSAPNVNEPILTGSSQITMGGGKNAIREAADLSDLLQTGRLDAPAKIVALQNVGATLGEGTVKAGRMSFIIAFLVIFVLMLVYYNTAGWVANIALILNLLFTVGVLASLHGTLTAAGIAGLVLTIGMAVDTNVIIFERIKEELTKGKSYQQAVIEGYKRSLPPVLDAHFTTFLTALILFIFGLGPVKGFATMQMLGISLSLFCGILVSRLITDWWTNKNRHLNYFTPISRRIFKHANFKFIEYRKVAYIISIFVALAGIGSYFNGYEKGVEFKGGTSFVVRFDKPVNTDEVKKSLASEKIFNETPVVKTQGNSRTLNITTSYLKLENNADSLKQIKLYEGLKPMLGNITYDEFSKNHIQGSNSVSPAISEDLKSGAVKATIIAIVIIFLYIFLRFSDWRYSLGTIVALLHDVFITLAVFSFLKHVVPFPLEIDQHFIAAVLTVIGFSMNDTVIVFDRVREYSRLMPKGDKGTIINRAINDTLSRTIMTSLTVFLTILILFIFGGEATRGFSFAMLIGVITGTYSSIFVAAPILVDFAKSKPLGEAEIFGSSDTKPVTKKA